MANATNFTKPSESSTKFGIKNVSPFILLLQNASALLMQNGIQKLLLGLGNVSPINIVKGTQYSTNFGTGKNFLLLQNIKFFLLQDKSKLLLEGMPVMNQNFTKPSINATNYT